MTVVGGGGGGGWWYEEVVGGCKLVDRKEKCGGRMAR